LIEIFGFCHENGFILVNLDFKDILINIQDGKIKIKRLFNIASVDDNS